jgi:fatty acid desaturase
MPILKKYVSDGLVAVGLSAFAVGLWWIYPPACLLFSGAALVAVGMLMGK